MRNRRARPACRGYLRYPALDAARPRCFLALVTEPGVSEVIAPLLFEPALLVARELRASQKLDWPWRKTLVDPCLD